jgi:hypothetical protein
MKKEEGRMQNFKSLHLERFVVFEGVGSDYEGVGSDY